MKYIYFRLKIKLSIREVRETHSKKIVDVEFIDNGVCNNEQNVTLRVLFTV